MAVLDPKPIGYDIGPGYHGGWIATLVHDSGRAIPLIVAQGRSERRVRKRAARAVVRALRDWEHRHGHPHTRVVLVPPTVGPVGGAGDSGARSSRRARVRVDPTAWETWRPAKPPRGLTGSIRD